MRKCCKNIGAIFLKFDCIGNNNLNRINNEQSHQTYVSATLHCSFIFAFVYFFFAVILYSLQRNQIIASFQPKDSHNLKVLHQNLTIAVGINEVPQNYEKYFKISLRQKVIDRTKKENKQIYKTLPQKMLEKCQRKHFNHSPEIQKAFDHFDFGNKYLCLPHNFDFDFKGTFSEDYFSYTQFIVERCNNKTHKCATDEQFKKKFLNHKGYLYFNAFFINDLINPNKKVYKTHNLEDRYYLQFSPKMRNILNIYLTHYEIETDQSILPEAFSWFEDKHTQEGIQVQFNEDKQMVILEDDNTQMAVMTLRLAKYEKLYKRHYHKIYEYLSFYFSLAGFVYFFLFCWVRCYNKHSLETSFFQNEKLERIRSEFQKMKENKRRQQNQGDQQNKNCCSNYNICNCCCYHSCYEFCYYLDECCCECCQSPCYKKFVECCDYICSCLGFQKKYKSQQLMNDRVGMERYQTLGDEEEENEPEREKGRKREQSQQQRKEERKQQQELGNQDESQRNQQHMVSPEFENENQSASFSGKKPKSIIKPYFQIDD